MKKKAIALAIASAMVAPNAFAAQDTSGMQYTSASEGFWASLRVRWNSGEKDGESAASKHSAEIQNSGSRFGVRGSNDLGNGLVGFYAYEAGMDAENGGSLETRQLHVGLRGNFGEVRAGSFWAAPYNMVYGSTDVANKQSASLLVGSHVFPGRISRSVQYTTPNLNGFQGAVIASMVNDDRYDADENTVANGENAVDYWALAGSYSISGFTVAGTYNTRADYTNVLLSDPDNDNSPIRALIDQVAAIAEADDDTTHSAQVERGLNNDVDSWALRLAYEQDNWYVTSWYGETNYSDVTYEYKSTTDGVETEVVQAASDPQLFSIAAGVAVDKVNLYAVYDSLENAEGADGAKDHYGTVGVQYNLGSKSRVWIEYASQDLDTDADADDYVNIGLRHDF
ncbi:porin [Candidatus Persebacteraceae bacterium Df01]|uniref:Porin n=1 Tax=Candidatus Doriopsillibacter californiensis TaxID=2970740 RepID=A0ABT7QLR0_9GAMM|nr:porin [Candidatus Persebacteraceae bacterium Df01]